VGITSLSSGPERQVEPALGVMTQASQM